MLKKKVRECLVGIYPDYPRPKVHKSKKLRDFQKLFIRAQTPFGKNKSLKGSVGIEFQQEFHIFKFMLTKKYKFIQI